MLMPMPRPIALHIESVAASDHTQDVIAVRMRVKWYVVSYLTKVFVVVVADVIIAQSWL